MPIRLSKPSGAKGNLFGPTIKKLRMGNNLTQREFLARLNALNWPLDQASLSRIETGERAITDHEIAMMLRVLGRKWAEFDTALPPGDMVMPLSQSPAERRRTRREKS